MFGTRFANRSRRTSGLRRDRVLRSAILGLLTYALGLVPFYFLTPVHQSVGAIFAAPPAPVATTTLSTATPTPTASTAERQKKVGAEIPAVVDLSPQPVKTLVPTATAVPNDPRYAFLLLGYGGGNHDGTYLTDSMMVVVVDPKQKTLTMLSLPRDSWVPLLFDGQTAHYDKINTAYAFAKDPSLFTDRLDKYTGDRGGGTFAMDTVSRLIGVPITYYVGLDFDGFRRMINAVGGVDVDVPIGFAARYPANDDPAVDPSWITIRFNAGMQHMTGERAIEYARARETIDDSNEGSDFARSRRQRLIIEAFKARLFQPGGLVHLPELLAIASQHVDTNYALPAVTQLSQLALDWKDVRFYQTALTVDNYLEVATGPEGSYILVPSSPDHSWAQVRAFTRRLWKDPPTGVAIAATTIVVENDTGVPGVAGQVSQDLVELGYNVGTPITGTVRSESRVVDKTGGKAALVISQLGKDLGVNLTPVDTTDAPTDEVILQLGSNDADLKVDVPADGDAPFSSFGVSNFGSWAPYVPPTPTAAPILSPSPERSGVAAPATPSPVGSPSVVAGSPTAILATPTRRPTPRPTPTPAKKKFRRR